MPKTSVVKRQRCKLTLTWKVPVINHK